MRESGYDVLEAAHPDDAQADQRIDLLLTDVVIPSKSGRVLAETAKVLRKGIRILYTTGYSRNAIAHQGRLDSDVNLITKPFTFDQQAMKVRDVLDRRHPN